MNILFVKDLDDLRPIQQTCSFEEISFLKYRFEINTVFLISLVRTLVS